MADASGGFSCAPGKTDLHHVIATGWPPRRGAQYARDVSSPISKA